MATDFSKSSLMFHLTCNMREQSFWKINCNDNKTHNNQQKKQYKTHSYAKQNLQTNVKTQ